MEQIPIIGGTPEEQDMERKKLLELAEEMKGDVWGIREKTGEQLDWIDMVNRYIGEEMKELGLEYSPIDQTQVRFLNSLAEWNFVTNAENKDGIEGIHNNRHRTISINLEEVAKNAREKTVDLPLKEFAVLLHEALHEKGFLKFRIDDDWTDSYRVGFNIMSDPNKFHGFNEGVTELLTLRLLDLHRDEIKKKFDVDLTTEEDKNNKGSVWNYINRRNEAVLVSNIYEKDYDTLWKAYFTGDMMHLRDIEKRYGKGALRILSLLDDGEEVDGEAKIKMIYAFFDEETDGQSREDIRAKLLS